MIELFVLFVGAAPFVIGYYAFQYIRNDDDKGSDDMPPPPDPEPPRPILPPGPDHRRTHLSKRMPRSERNAVAHQQVTMPRRRTSAR